MFTRECAKQRGLAKEAAEHRKARSSAHYLSCLLTPSHESAHGRIYHERVLMSFYGFLQVPCVLFKFLQSKSSFTPPAAAQTIFQH
jgi:hypothetical protein